MARRLIGEPLPALVVEQALLLIAAQALRAHRRPVARVGQVDARLDDHLEDVRHVVLGPRRHPAVHHVEIEPAVVVVVEELGAPAPAGVGGSGLARDVAEGQVPVVAPEEVTFLHVLVGDVRHVHVE